MSIKTKEEMLSEMEKTISRHENLVTQENLRKMFTKSIEMMYKEEPKRDPF